MIVSPSTRLPRDCGQHDPGRPRLLRLEPLEDRRLLSATRAADAINQFAYDVYEHMQNEQGNLFYSPLSVATALAMTYAGAAGQTASEMAEVLHVGAEPGIHSSFADLLSIFETQTNTIDNFDLIVANAIWPALSLPVKANFLGLVTAYYDGMVQNLDYSNPAAAEDIINDWIEQKTNGKIEDLVDNLSPLTSMVLTNTVYFKGLWDDPFDPRATRNGQFRLAEGGTVTVPIMHTQTDLWTRYINGYQVLEMPFDGGAATMAVILPYGSSSFDMTRDTLAEINEALNVPAQPSEELWLDIFLPKFDVTVSTDLKPVLAGLGMPSAFTPDADFSNMSPQNTFVDEVAHKATIKLTEQGTEAAAATQVGMVLCFAAGTPVLTPDGEKPIEQLQAGDLVLARDEFNVEGPVEPKPVERLLTGFGELMELHVAGQVIRTTSLHRFFVRGQGWTAAGDIKVEDRLSTNHGDWIEVEKVLGNGAPEPLYNLRVSEHHTYFVGSRSWKLGVWVHNDYWEFDATRPFHFFIRDNATSTITFMGRINDPTQTVNEVTPTVPPSNADFDGDGDVDGRDFLAWQRGCGMTIGAARANGDSNADGDVDGGDLSTWRTSYGQVTSTPLAAVIDSSEPTANDPITDARALVLEEGRELELLDNDFPAGQAITDVQTAVDRAFDHWTPPRHSFADFGDIATRRMHRQKASSLPVIEF